MADVTVKRSTRPDYRLDIFHRTYLELLASQKDVCLSICTTMEPGEHCEACTRKNSVLLEAEAVLADWFGE